MNKRYAILAVTIMLTAINSGCGGYRGDENLLKLTSSGSYGEAREHLQQTLTTNPGDRNFLLDRKKLALVSLADGVPEATEGNIDHLYDYLRIQGLNEDRTVGSFFVGEGAARIWKGEPFEQAMGYHYVAVFDGQMGDWGNVRAAANNSLFLLRDFSDVLQETMQSEVGEQLAEEEDDDLRRRQALVVASNKKDREIREPDTLGVDYSPVASDFELGYLMKAIAADQLGLSEELNEAIAQIRQIVPRLSSLADQIRSGRYNTVLVVDYGFAPEKIRTGPDGAIASFAPRRASCESRLIVSSVDGTQHVPVATDLNRLALDLKWNNLEDMRLAKSYIGTGMMAAGAAVAATSGDSTEQMIAGIGLMLAGAAMKATAGADTRHCEILPQRSYVALLNLPESPSTIDLQLEGQANSRFTLAGLSGPAPGEPAKLRYVRLPQNAAEWATSGAINYSNDRTGAIDGPQLPYILGGRCVRTPSHDVLQSYQDSGYLADYTLDDLIELYREEGIVIPGLLLESERQLGRHILEGGNALYTPLVGTTGFARLFGSTHPPYTPRSELVLQLRQQLHAPEQEVAGAAQVERTARGAAR